MPAILAVATIGSTAAIVRAGARVYLGAGDDEDPLLSENPTEAPPPQASPSLPVLQALTLLLAVASLVVGAWTGLAADAVEAAHQFTNGADYANVVLDHSRALAVPAEHWHTTTSALLWSVVTLVGSFAVGVVSLYRNRFPERLTGALAAGLRPLRVAHSGHIGDYVAWLAFGAAVVSGLLAVTIR